MAKVNHDTCDSDEKEKVILYGSTNKFINSTGKTRYESSAEDTNLIDEVH